MVDEPDVASSISILRGLKERYEQHHRVRIQDDAIIAAVSLSHRYITDRFLPDKAIDLMDEAAAHLRMERDSVPEELDELMRREKQLEIEREAIKRENDKEKLGAIDEELKSVNTELTTMKKQWEQEKSQAERIQNIKAQQQSLKEEAERREREGDYARVAEIRYSKLPELEKQLQDMDSQLSALGSQLLREEVTSEDIAEIVARWTGIPVAKMQATEREKLLNLEAELHQRVIGQDEAIRAVSDAVRRSRAGLQDPKRPIGSFIFLGTTGVGKTELARALADYLFDDEQMMTRIDMSEYQEKFSVTRLIGAPPGYVGYDEGGQLTEAVRRKPYSVVLFDEIEKAHPDVFNTLLQVLDDGRLTDSKGRTVNFKNTLIIMTSNYTREQLFQTVRPEFLNRVDEIITFTALSESEIREIVKLQLSTIQKRLKDNDITMNVSEGAVDILAREGYSPEFGARPVKRAIQHLLLNNLSSALIAGTIDRTKPIEVEAEGDSIVFHN